MAERLKGKGNIGIMVADVGSEEGIMTRAREITSLESKLHSLVNNVGATHKAPVAGFARSEFKRVLNINITAAFECVRSLLPLLKGGGASG